jgi:ketosteroid isomerase-like protein
MTPSSDERDAIFKAFGRAFFKQDMELMYQVITDDFTWTVQDDESTRILNSREKIAGFFAERRGKFENIRFEDVVFNHAPKATFMTYRMTGTESATGAKFARVGVERYTFRDGKLTEKDVYSRPADV